MEVWRYRMKGRVYKVYMGSFFLVSILKISRLNISEVYKSMEGLATSIPSPEFRTTNFERRTILPYLDSQNIALLNASRHPTSNYELRTHVERKRNPALRSDGKLQTILPFSRTISLSAEVIALPLDRISCLQGGLPTCLRCRFRGRLTDLHLYELDGGDLTSIELIAISAPAFDIYELR